MTDYVLGFLFSPDWRKIALIQKLKPEWQRGSYNGIGGAIEEKDLGPFDAMHREFLEETGAHVRSWKLFANLVNAVKDWRVSCFYTTDYMIDALKSPTEEQVHVFTVKSLPENLVGNVRWLIPMAMSMEYYKTNMYEINEH